MARSTWNLPSQRPIAVACVGEDDHVDELLRAALANRRSLPPVEEFCRVRVVPDADRIWVVSKLGERLAWLSSADAFELRPRIEAATAGGGELWCDARIRGSASPAAQWRMQIWVYFEDYGATV